MSVAVRRPARGAATRASSDVRVARREGVDPAAQRYVGLVTRALAFALDAAIIDAVALLTAAVAAVTFSVVPIPQDLRAPAAAAGGALFLLWTACYFVTFWASTGQTPGSRLLRIRVRAASGDRLRPRRALLRFAGLTLAALPLFAGFLVILVDDRRRGLHDRLARTVVVEDEDDPSRAQPARRARPSSSAQR